MNLGLQARLVLGTSLGVFVVLCVSGFWLHQRLLTRTDDNVRTELKKHAASVRELILAAPNLGIESDAIAERMGEILQLRVTIIAGTGVVIGDSHIPGPKLATLSNHLNRPELVAARRAPFGVSRRFSTTLEADMLYVATRFERPEGGGWVRVAVKLSRMEQLAADLETMLVGAGLVTLVFMMLVGAKVSQVVSSRIRKLVTNVRTLSQRAIESRSQPSGVDDLGFLAQSIDRMSDDVERLVRTLAHERDQFDGVLHGMQEAVIAFDRASLITIINDSAKNLFALRGDYVGSRVDAVHELAPIQVAFDGALPNALSWEFELERPVPKTVLAQLTPISGSGGWVVVAHDVTEIRKLERMRQDFVANVSHELRTPVSVIRANSETLLDGALTDERQARQFVSAVLRNAERLSSLVGDLLDLSQIEAGQYPMNLVPLGLVATFRRAVDSVSHAAASKQMALVVKEADDLHVLADVQALDQVLSNLVLNAVRYTPAGGCVTIRFVSAAPRVRIEVEDNGPGIAPEHRERLFERFYRVDPGRSKQMGGTGLGLAIVKHLVHAMGGTVGMVPAPKAGSVFWLELEQAPAKPPLP